MSWIGLLLLATSFQAPDWEQNGLKANNQLTIQYRQHHHQMESCRLLSIQGHIQVKIHIFFPFFFTFPAKIWLRCARKWARHEIIKILSLTKYFYCFQKPASMKWIQFNQNRLFYKKSVLCDVYFKKTKQKEWLAGVHESFTSYYKRKQSWLSFSISKLLDC